MRKFVFFVIMGVNLNVHGYSYDMEQLPADFKNSTDIVIAKKVSGIMPLAFMASEIDEYQKLPIDWRNSPAWKRLQKSNSEESTFLVMNSIKGSYEVGGQFRFNDGWLPVELGSVKLYFLTVRDGSVYSEPCLRVSIDRHKKKIVSLSADPEALIVFY